SGLTHSGTEIEISGGSFGRSRFDFGHGMQWGDGWHGYLAGTLFQEQGWRERSPGSLGNLFMKFGRHLSDSDWSLVYSHAQSELTGNGLLNESLYAVDRSAGYTFSDLTRNVSDIWSINWQRRMGAGDQINAMAWYRRSQRDGWTGDISSAWADWLEACASTPLAAACTSAQDPAYVAQSAVINRTSTLQSGSGAALQWAHSASTQRLAFGLELMANQVAYDQYAQAGRFDAQRVAQADISVPQEWSAALRGNSQTVSLYGTDTVSLGPRTLLTLSGRWNQTWVSNDIGVNAPVSSESFLYSKFNPAFGLVHSLSDDWNVFSNWSQGTRVPTSIELGCADPEQPCVLPTGLQADPYLKQVVAQTLELGSRARLTEHVQLSAALFRTRSQDDIVFVRSGASQAGYFTNVGDTLRQGLELAARWRSPGWQGYVNYTYLRATYESDGVLNGPLSTLELPNSIHSGSPLAGMPQHMLKVGADWHLSPVIDLGADLQTYSSQVVAGNESGNRPELGRVEGYAVLNARATWQVDARWQAFLRVNNVLDRNYSSFAAGNTDYFPAGRALEPGSEALVGRFLAPGAPRALWLGARYEWNQ
ncbi:MAG: TonB-dependent receptor domain-containing protein, partial [Rhodoferax sp.]